MKDIQFVQYSTPLPETAKVGDPVLLDIAYDIGSWRQHISVRYLMLGNISHTTKTQFVVSVPGWESLRFNRRGGLRRDSADGCSAHKKFNVALLDHRVTGEFAVEDELDKNDPATNENPVPTFFARGVSQIEATNSRIRSALEKANELWSILPVEWKNASRDRRSDRIPYDVAHRIAANPDAIEKLNDLYVTIGEAFGVGPKEEEE